jgi:hypothetical protein
MQHVLGACVDLTEQQATEEHAYPGSMCNESPRKTKATYMLSNSHAILFFQGRVKPRLHKRRMRTEPDITLAGTHCFCKRFAQVIVCQHENREIGGLLQFSSPAD